ncbi:hypothetical protein HDU90_008560 [Geranomyces variabilis]|nr:hypothetical protein HDU90_008560 [Geranomyces variabilis]
MHPRGRNHRNKLAKLLCYQERSLAFLKVLKEEGLDFLYMVDTHRRRLRPATQGFEGKELVSAQLPLGQEDVMHAGKMLMSALVRPRRENELPVAVPPDTPLYNDAPCASGSA